MTSYHSHARHIEQRSQDASDFISIGGTGLQDATVILAELNFLEFSDVYDSTERNRLYEARDEAVRKINREIEEAE